MKIPILKLITVGFKNKNYNFLENLDYEILPSTSTQVLLPLSATDISPIQPRRRVRGTHLSRVDRFSIDSETGNSSQVCYKNKKNIFKG